MSYASYIYKRRESGGTFYFRSPCQFGNKRYSLRTRILREAKQRAAICLTELQLYGMVDMGKYDKTFLGKPGDGWLLPDAEKITWVKENIPDQIPKGRESDNAFLIKMFNIYTKKKGISEDALINKMASTFYDFPELVRQTTSQPTIHSAETVKNLTVQELIEEFLEMKKGAWSDEHFDQSVSRYGLVSELLGKETVVRSLRTRDFSRLVKNLQLLPARRNKKCYQSLNLAQLLPLDIPKQERFSITTINAIIDLVNKLFRYAAKEDYVEKNYADELKKEVNVKNVKKKLKKVPYTAEELQRIIDYSWKKEKRPDRRYIPAIAMLSGMRLNEICQLTREDVIQEEGIWYFRVIEEDDKNHKVKSDAGHRKLPVHSKLLSIGLIDHVQSIRSGRLWPKLTRDKRGRFSGAIQSGFSRINNAHITKEQAKSFHSTRHSVTTALMNAGEQRHLYQKVIGHEADEAPIKDTTAIYEGEIELSLAKEIIEKIQYKPELNFEIE